METFGDFGRDNVMLVSARRGVLWKKFESIGNSHGDWVFRECE